MFEGRSAVIDGFVIGIDPTLDDELWPDLIASATDEPLPLTPVEQIVTAAVEEPVSPLLIEALDTIDPAQLNDFDVVCGLQAWTRVRESAAAGQLDMVAELLARETRHSRPGEWVEAPGRVAAEVGAALRLDPVRAARLVSTAMQLTGPLTATLTALRRGDVAYEHAAYLAEQTMSLSDEHARAVEALVLAKAGRRTAAQHRVAVRKAVERVDPDGAEERRRQAGQEILLVRTHLGSGMAEVWAQLPSADADILWAGADVAARRWKAAGDPRPLDALRVAVLVHWARTFLLTGTPLDPTDPTDPTDETDEAPPPPVDPVTGEIATATTALRQPAPSPVGRSVPVRHGRRVTVGVLWDLTSLLGLTRHPGELLDSGTPLSAAAMRELLAGGVRARRMLIDPATGELLDLTPSSWALPGTDPTATPDPLLTLAVIVEADLHTALTTGDSTGLTAERVALVDQITAALHSADPDLRAALDALLTAPVTADDLDNHPGAETPGAALAEFIALRDRHPSDPTAGPTSAAAGDNDHALARSHGGTTTRDNLHTPRRHWHVLKTHHGWTVHRHGHTWRWTSPTGHTYDIEPYDYRLGP